MFRLNQLLTIDKDEVTVIFVSPQLLVVKDTDNQVEHSYSIQQAQQWYLDGTLRIHNAPRTITEEELSEKTTFMTPSQRQELHLKSALVNHFMSMSVPVGKKARKVIKKICRHYGITQYPAESTVRNYVTRFKTSGCKPFSLLDSRRRIPVYRE